MAPLHSAQSPLHYINKLESELLDDGIADTKSRGFPARAQ
jgi:hypothetical protein